MEDKLCKMISGVKGTSSGNGGRSRSVDLEDPFQLVYERFMSMSSSVSLLHFIFLYERFCFFCKTREKHT